MVLRGIVTSAAQHKTCIVKVVRSELHPIYKKARLPLLRIHIMAADSVWLQSLQRIQHYKVHDEAGLAGKGDTVTIAPAGRRISLNKSYLLRDVVAKAHVRKVEGVAPPVEPVSVQAA